MKNKKYVYAFVTLAVLTTLALTTPVFADTTSTTTPGTGSVFGNHMGGRGGMRPGVFGTVSAVNGNTITVTGKQGFGANATSTTFTVDATNAKIMKNNTAGTISSIVVGDTIAVQGTINGTNVVATTIRDGLMNRKMTGVNGKTNQKPSPITGNGQPVVAGAVSSINGSTLTITNKSNVSYTIDATNAKIVQGQNTISLSNIAIGDMVVVQGTVNGNAVTASSIIDQAKPANTSTTTGQTHTGFFAGIGSFFAHLFGF
jgi:hypothetical protein